MLDICLKVEDNYFPVEFKYTSRQSKLNHKYQLVAYAMLLEESFQRPVRSGLLYLTLREEIVEVPITAEARQFVRETMANIRKLVEPEKMPRRNKYKNRCRDCEYRNFCGDVE